MDEDLERAQRQDTDLFMIQIFLGVISVSLVLACFLLWRILDAVQT